MRNDADEIKVGEQVLALGYPIAEDVEDLTGCCTLFRKA